MLPGMKLLSSVKRPIDKKVYKEYGIPDEYIPDENYYLNTYQIQDIAFFRRRAWFVK